MAALTLGWKQLWHQKLRLLVALLGIAFAVILILMQLGFRSSLFESAVRYHERLVYDVALFSVDSQFIVRPASFSSRRLYQAKAIEGVSSVSPVYIFPATWKNPYSSDRRSIFTIGVDPSAWVLDAPGVAENLGLLHRPDVVLFDAASRPEHGPVTEHFRAGEEVHTEVNDRSVEVVGLFEMGTSFGLDASILTSDTNFLRLFPHRERTQIDLGLIRLEEGVDPEDARDRIAALLPDDVLVMTKQDFVDRETAYWNSATPIGYVFSFGAIMGFVVGAIIVYQILYADVADHLPEYATLKAMGYSNLYLSWVVTQQAMTLAVLGFIPGVFACRWLYARASEATSLPMYLTEERGTLVLLLTIAMCSIAGLIAMRKVRSADPADVF
jgi:putative ABC transport system permease protein